MPISFERNVLSESFEQVSLLEPHFEFGLGAGGWRLGAGGWRLKAGGWGLGVFFTVQNIRAVSLLFSVGSFASAFFVFILCTSRLEP